MENPCRDTWRAGSLEKPARSQHAPHPVYRAKSFGFLRSFRSSRYRKCTPPVITDGVEVLSSGIP